MTHPIPIIPLVTIPVRPLNNRFWELADRELRGTITEAEKAELDTLCEEMEREGDDA